MLSDKKILVNRQKSYHFYDCLFSKIKKLLLIHSEQIGEETLTPNSITNKDPMRKKFRIFLVKCKEKMVTFAGLVDIYVFIRSNFGFYIHISVNKKIRHMNHE